MKHTHNLGIGLIPSPKSQKYISKLANQICTLKIPSLNIQKNNIPHMTLFQGKFSDKKKIIEEIKTIKFDERLKQQEIKEFSIWAEEWLFLEFKKNKVLTKTHNNIVNKLVRYIKGKAVDFLNEKTMTAGQKKSFKETGYQFSKKEFMPHITLCHIEPKQKNKEAITKELNSRLKKPLNKKLLFNRIVVYKTGKNGSCTDIIYEKRFKNVKNNS